nr:MAG TPA: hypothetical protein [Caudoviricetes sp.]
MSSGRCGRRAKNSPSRTRTQSSNYSKNAPRRRRDEQWQVTSSRCQ